MIEDNELRELFKIECNEHAQQLTDGLLRLEKNPTDQDTINMVFREAHSLKGAARMVGVSSVELIAHSLENILGGAKEGECILPSETIDRIYKGIDSLRKFVNEAITGENAGINVQDVLSSLTKSETPQRMTEHAEVKREVKPSEPETKDILSAVLKPASPAEKELHDLFKGETEEHLQHINDGLLQLEKYPEDRQVIEIILRELHNLKGAASMIQLADVGVIIHQIEHILSAAQREEQNISSDIINHVYRAVDAIRMLIHEAITGEPAHLKVADILSPITDTGTRTTKSPGEIQTPDAKHEEYPTNQSKIQNQELMTPYSAPSLPHLKSKQSA